jgi:phosphoribosylaminoimidazolecarboxamide formyltransferase/IMP cyclohydrolase
MSSRPYSRCVAFLVYHKDRLAPLVQVLRQHGVTLYSHRRPEILEDEGAEVTAVEDLTGFLRYLAAVKTLHPKVFMAYSAPPPRRG